MKLSRVPNRADLLHKKFVTGFQKLKQKENYLEKTNPLPKVLEKLSKEDIKANELVSLNVQQKLDRKSHTNDILVLLEDLRDSFQRLKLNIDEEHLKNNDLQYYKNSVLDIENRISTFKQLNCFELEILRAAIDSDKSIVMLDRLINKSLRPMKNPSNVRHAVLPRVKADNSQTCEESKIFQNYLETRGGHTGGWSHEDHSAFLRIKAKYKEDSALVKAVQSQMPDLSEEVILQHKYWYNKYEQLKEMQNIAIKKWRESRTLTRSNTTVTPKLSKARSSQSAKSATERTKSATLPDREFIKKQIELWKIQKQEKQKECNKNHYKKLKSLKDKVCYEKMYHMMKKEQLAKWQEERRATTQEKLAQIELEELKKHEIRADANRLLSEFRAQDEMFTQRKLQMAKNARPKIPLGTIPLGSNTCSASAFRDPNRLFRATESSRRRTMTVDNEEAVLKADITRNMSIRNVPKLGIPSWRLNMKKLEGI